MRAVGGILTTQQSPIFIFGVPTKLAVLSVVPSGCLLFFTIFTGLNVIGMPAAFVMACGIFLWLRQICRKNWHFENELIYGRRTWRNKKHIIIKPGTSPSQKAPKGKKQRQSKPVLEGPTDLMDGEKENAV